MPPPLAWDDLRGRRVGVWGVGVEGRSALRRLRALGVTPVLVDDLPPPDGLDGLEVLVTGKVGLGELAGCEVVIKSPGISIYRPEMTELASKGVAVVGGLGLWLESAPVERVVGVVGTKGKSTTAAILGALIGGLGRSCFVGGNLGSPPYDVDAPAGVDYWVIEISSFQVMSLTRSPAVLALTSLHPDHLDWHGTAKQYFRDKLSVCTKPGARVVVANGDDELIGRHRDLLGRQVRWVTSPADAPGWVEQLGLIGRHNLTNALIARVCLDELGLNPNDEELFRAAGSFAPLESRLRPVACVDGVDFIDDSLSTNALPTMAALDAFPGRRVALLVGGLDRGIDYSGLVDYLHRRTAPTLVLTMPQNGNLIAAELEGRFQAPSEREVLPQSDDPVAEALDAPGRPIRLEVRRCRDLAEAVPAGFRWAQPDGVVLLSPAAASFGLFRDYRDRAEQFLAQARSLTQFL
ncbi:MAG: UDP-N-acetylmuramoyl-L-alanine--D-glutamate ligase [Actinomycetota bacterium]